MNIRFVGIDGLGWHEVNRIFSKLKVFEFIKDVKIRKVPDVIFYNDRTRCEVLNSYDVTIEIEPDRADYVSIHVFDNSIHIVDCGYGFDKAIVYIDRSAYERLEII